MKRIMWVIGLILAGSVIGQAQVPSQQIEQKVQRAVVGQFGGTLFCMLTGLCFTEQTDSNGQPVINMQQVEEALQKTVQWQDVKMHDLYTENYLTQAQKQGKTLEITRNAQDPRQLDLLGDFYLFQEAKEFDDFSTNNLYTHPRGNQGITIVKGRDSSLEKGMDRLRDLLAGTGFKLQTYDLRKSNEGMVSFYKTMPQGGHYVVFRVLRARNGEIVTVNVARTLASQNLKIMRAMFQALRNTAPETLTEHFVERTCKMGADCY